MFVCGMMWVRCAVACYNHNCQEVVLNCYNVLLNTMLRFYKKPRGWLNAIKCMK